MHEKGYTLIEILVASMIFAILSTITSYAIKRMHTQITQVKHHYQQLEQINEILHSFQEQTQHLVKRSIRANEERRFPLFIGQEDYVEWTYYDWSTRHLERIAYLCRDQNLIFRRWQRLDPIKRSQYNDKILLQNLNHCSFRYLHPKQEIAAYWNNGIEEVPQGLELMLDLQNQSELHYWFQFEPTSYVYQDA